MDNISAPLDSAGLATALSSPTPIGNTTPNTGAFTTLTATTGNITTVNATTVNAATITATGTVTAETLTFEGGGSMTKPSEPGIQAITASVAGNALTVTLSATTLDFRSATLSSGTVVARVIASPISVVVSSGSTLGTVSAVQSRIVVLAIDNAGTVELAVVNIAGGNDLTETGLISTTAEGGGGSADSASTIYSTTARTNVAYRVVGYVESTQATAGTWVTAPSTIQGYGGQALASMSSIGYGQTWQTVTRTSGTTYYNTTGKPIFIAYEKSTTGSCELIVNGVTVGNAFGNAGVAIGFVSAVIPVGASYSLNATAAAVRELR